MNERLKFQGRLVVKDKEAKRLKIRIESNRDSLREALDPTAPVNELEESRISTLGITLAGQIVEYNNILAEMKAIEKALGTDG
ncbi:MAG: hypothetical protein JRD05_00655 [Deltaproteobacteria bacterium]|nr:hypothetical protein [Deltaproteobacteria bacterium]